MEDALVLIKKNRVEDPKKVLILVLMEDALVLKNFEKAAIARLS